MSDATEELKDFYNYMWGLKNWYNPTFVYLPVEHETSGRLTCLLGLGKETG